MSPIQANLFANAERSSDVLAVLIQHDGLWDTPTTLKASQAVIIKAEMQPVPPSPGFCSLTAQDVAL